MKKELLVIESSAYKEIIYDDKTIEIVGKGGASSSSGGSFRDERDLEEWFKRQIMGWVGNIMWAVNNGRGESDGGHS